MEGIMRAWYALGAEKMELRNVSIPKVKETEVLIKIKAAGICGSDIHFYKDGQIGPYIMNEPLILGHECSGVIVEMGAKVEGHMIGEHVVVEPGVPCGRCHECRTGRYNFCDHMRFMGTPPDNGCMSEYVAWPADLVYKMPDEMSFEEGAMVEPFVVGLQSMRNAKIGFSDNAVVIGDGPIGLMTVQALKTISAGVIICIGRTEMKLALAKQMGATHVLNTREVRDIKACVQALTGGLGAMYVFECVGSDATYKQSEELVREGGTVCLIGLLVHDGTPMPMSSSVMRGITYVPMIRYTNLFEEAITLLTYKRSEILPIMTHTFRFADSAFAYQKAVHDRHDSEKIVIVFDD